MKEGPPMVQTTADIEGSVRAVRSSERRLVMEDWMPVSGVKSSRTW